MKKIFLSLFIVFTASCITAETLYSQQLKVAVFDIDLMVKTLPQYKFIDSLLPLYQQPEISPNEYYELMQSELKKIDSIFLNPDTYSGNGNKFFDSLGLIKQKIGLNLIYWQEKKKETDSICKRKLAEPLYERVKAAFLKVVNENKYDVILKPNAIDLIENIDNLFIAVAKELELDSLPDQLLQIGNRFHLHY